MPWITDDTDLSDPGLKLEMVTHNLLCVGMQGAPFNASKHNTYSWHPALASAGIERAGKATGFHRLRHAYGTYLLYEGKPLLDVQGRLRHRKLEELVRVYAHVIKATESEQMERAIAGVFESLLMPGAEDSCSVSVP